MNPTAIASAPSPSDIGLVIAIKMEVGPFLDRLTKVRKYHAARTTVLEGEIDGRVVSLVFTGMGRIRAQRGAQTLIDGHRPARLISAGFGGALAPGLRRNEIVQINEVVNIEGRTFPIEVPTLEGPPPPTSRLLTTDAVVMTAAEKAALHARYGADVVDMETSAVAAYAAERGVRFHAVRVVSDEAGVDLPREILTIVGETGGVRLGATLGALWKRPSAIGDLLTMRGHAIEASEKLSDHLLRLIASIG